MDNAIASPLFNMPKTPDQEALWKHVEHYQPYHHLAELPDEICKALLRISLANKGGGWWQIKASHILKKLAAMTHDEIVEAFKQSPEAFEIGAAPNGVEI